MLWESMLKMYTTTYIANKHGVYADNFDQESVIVNLNLGNYYNVCNLASQIWNTLELGAKPMDLVTQLADFYKIDQATIKQDMERFISNLINEGLILELEQGSHQDLNLDNLPSEYKAPVLETFNDLQDLFLLDPVHAIDDKMGWPIQANK